MLPIHLLGLSSRWCFSRQHPLPPQGGLPDLDIYLYNKPGGQGTGGKGTTLQGAGLCHSRALARAFSCLAADGALPSLTAQDDLEVLGLSLRVGFYRGCLHHSSIRG